jgi:hypothetical protein
MPVHWVDVITAWASGTEPGADRGPQAGSPLGVVDATGFKHSTGYHRSFYRLKCRLQVGRRIRSLLPVL